MTNTDKKTMVNSQIRIIKELINKKASNEEKAKRFIQTLPVFTEQSIRSKNEIDFNKNAK